MDRINPPYGYKYGLDSSQIKEYWPNLIENQNFHFTSFKTPNYNCVAWVIGVNDVWIDMYDYFIEVLGLDESNLDHTINGYAYCFAHWGFEICGDGSFEEGIEKIAIYGDENNEFLHVAKQLGNGYWTSKMGGLEDIEHYDLNAVSGPLYGTPKLFMQKKISNGHYS